MNLTRTDLRNILYLSVLTMIAIILLTLLRFNWDKPENLVKLTTRVIINGLPWVILYLFAFGEWNWMIPLYRLVLIAIVWAYGLKGNSFAYKLGEVIDQTNIIKFSD